MPNEYHQKIELFCPLCRVNGFIEIRRKPVCPRCGIGKLTGANRRHPQVFLESWQDVILPTARQEYETLFESAVKLKNRLKRNQGLRESDLV